MAKKKSGGKSKAGKAGKKATKKSGGGKKKASKKAGKKSSKKSSKKSTAKKATAKSAGKKTTAKSAGAAKKTTAKSAGAKKTKRTLNPALRAPFRPSTELAAIVGETPLPRQEVVSKLWQYIKSNGLQDKQNINADDKLKPIFGNKSTVTMFEMQKHVSKHLTKAE